MTFFRRLLGYGFLALFLLQVPGCVRFFASPMLAWSLQSAETEPDHPLWREMTFRGPKKGEPTVWDRAAVLSYPDLNSCLFSWSDTPRWGDQPSMENLWYFRWRDLRTASEKQVCLWRVANYIGDAEKVSEWFRNQGFKSKSRSFTNSIGQSWTIVDAAWNLRASGARTPCRGLCFLSGVLTPYSMVVTSYWSADSQTLLALEIGYNTK
ncbi:MAG: hypothetical protein JJ911_06390 [Rhizobiaceae bacterium]|nr:hypothetical protein [Rhizobiaceae bacterium]